MTDKLSNQKKAVICHCSGTTEEQIKTLIDNGVNSFEKIAFETGAGTGCGSCDYVIMDLLNEAEQDKEDTSK